MDKLKPYPKYKPVNLPWLKEIPTHWEIPRAKKIFYIYDERSKDGKEELLSVSQNYGVVKRDSIDVTMFKAESYIGYKICYPDDFVVNSLWAWQYGLGISKYKGIISTAYSVYRLRNKNLYNCNFYNYLLRSNVYNWELRVRSKGIWKSRYQLHDASFLDMPLVQPPTEEQEKIVAYLDEKVTKIDKYIELKTNYIKMLEEELVSEIFNVTSRKKIIAWISLFPNSWQISKIKKIFKEVSIKGFPHEDLAAVTQDRGVILKKDCSQNYVSPDGGYEKQKLIQPCDFVISLRSFQGGIEFSKIRGLVSPAYTIFKLKEENPLTGLIEFYRTIFKSKPFISLLNGYATTIRDGKDISFEDISDIDFPIPDSTFLKRFYKKWLRYEVIKSSFEKQKLLLIEYKNSLISSVVTGKVQVA